jgi:hypothetical protein
MIIWLNLNYSYNENLDFKIKLIIWYLIYYFTYIFYIDKLFK